MADLFSVTAPLFLRRPDGSSQVIAHCFPHPRGLLYLDTFWHRSTPERSAHLIEGELTGDDPWKIGGCVIGVMGCQGTHPELQDPYAAWRDYLLEHGESEYPPLEQIREIARRLGGIL